MKRRPDALVGAAMPGAVVRQDVAVDEGLELLQPGLGIGRRLEVHRSSLGRPCSAEDDLRQSAAPTRCLAVA